MKCAGTKKCKTPAACLVTYGPKGNPEKTKDQALCDGCLNRLWDEVFMLVATGRMIYKVDSVPGERGRD